MLFVIFFNYYRNKKGTKIFIFNTILILVILSFSSCIGAGLSDWKYELPNEYEMWHVSSKNIKIGLTSSDKNSLTLFNGKNELIGIPPTIVAFSYTTRYVFAIVKPNTDIEIPDIENNVHYYVLDTLNKNVKGPFFEKKYFLQLLLNLSLEEELSSWYSTKNPTRGRAGKVSFGQDSIILAPFD